MFRLLQYQNNALQQKKLEALSSQGKLVLQKKRLVKNKKYFLKKFFSLALFN